MMPFLYYLAACAAVYAIEVRCGMLSWWLLTTKKQSPVTRTGNALSVIMVIVIMPILLVLQGHQWIEENC